MLSSNARVELGTDKSWFCPNVAGKRGSAWCRCGTAGRGAGDNRVRGFVEVEGCLEGGSGGCETSADDVVSIDKERIGIKEDVIWRRDVCSAADNMMRVCMQQGMHLPAASVTVTYTADRSRATPRSDSDRDKLFRRTHR